MGLAKNRMMELQDRGFGEVEGALCLAHVADVSLAGRLARSAEESFCDFCGRKRSSSGDRFAVSLEILLYELMETIRHFYSEANEELPWDSEEGGFVGAQSDTWEVVDNLMSGVLDAQVSDKVIEAVIEAIGLDVSWTDWSSRADTEDLEFAWDEFAQTARHTSRFVLPAAADPASPPAQLSRFLERLLMYLEADLDLVTDLPEGTSFFRGRLCEKPDRLHRDSRDLGPAPVGVASANRMSPAGISLFYASGDPDTAVAEIAGHGVEPLAVIGEFTNRRPLRVLDLTRTPPPISPFDLGRREQARMARFLESFIGYVTAPVIPDGRQHIEYAPTQVLTEFLRWVPQPTLDGIVLPSRQTARPTYVLFFGPRAFCTKGDSEPKHPSFLGFDDAVDDDPRLGVSFELDPDKVQTYRVHRIYKAEAAGQWNRAAEPRHPSR